MHILYCPVPAAMELVRSQLVNPGSIKRSHSASVCIEKDWICTSDYDCCSGWCEFATPWNDELYDYCK